MNRVSRTLAAVACAAGLACAATATAAPVQVGIVTAPSFVPEVKAIEMPFLFGSYAVVTAATLSEAGQKYLTPTRHVYSAPAAFRKRTQPVHASLTGDTQTIIDQILKS